MVEANVWAFLAPDVDRTAAARAKARFRAQNSQRKNESV